MQPEVMEVLLYEKLALEWHPKTGLTFGISPLGCPKLLTRECSESHTSSRPEFSVRATGVALMTLQLVHD